MSNNSMIAIAVVLFLVMFAPRFVPERVVLQFPRVDTKLVGDELQHGLGNPFPCQPGQRGQRGVA